MTATPTAAAGTQAGGATDRLDPALVRLALVLMLGALAAGLDTTIVNVAIDTLGRHFDASVSTVQWVSTGYLLGLTMVVPLTAWAVERVGARRLWVGCLATFAVSSALCGVAWSMPALIAFRVLQGVGGGMLLPLVRTILARAAGHARMGRMMVFVAVPGSLTPVLGPIIGGLVVNDLGWRWAFYVNVPLCLAGLLLALRVLPADRGGPAARSLDVAGLAVLSTGLAAAVYGLSAVGGHRSFTAAAAWIPLAVAGALLAGYGGHALRADAPLLDLRLFRARSFAASSAMLFLFGGSLFGALFLLPLYYQQVRGASVLHAGLLLAPLGAGMAVAMTVAGKVVDRVGGERAVTLTGMTLAVLGLLPYARAGEHTSQALLASALVVTGIGIGTVLLAGFTATYRGLSPEQFAGATSAARILQQIGGVLGTAVLAVVLQHGGAGRSAAAAFDHTFTWALVLTALGVVPALLLRRGGGRR